MKNLLYFRLISLVLWFDTDVFVSWRVVRKKRAEGGRAKTEVDKLTIKHVQIPLWGRFHTSKIFLHVTKNLVVVGSWSHS